MVDNPQKIKQKYILDELEHARTQVGPFFSSGIGNQADQIWSNSAFIN